MNRKIATTLFFILLAIAVSQFGCAQQDAHSEEKNDTKKAAADTSNVEKSAENKDEAKKADEKLVPVKVTRLSTGEMSATVLLSSNLETEGMADVYSRVQGIVEKIHVEEGSYARKGDVLITLEAAEYELAYEKAYVDFKLQKSLFERSKTMHAKELLSNEEFEQAKFNLESAEIAYKQAKLNLDYTKIEAPISGVVGERLVRVGDRVQPSDKLYTVVNTDDMIAIIHVPEKEIGAIQKGQKAYVTSDNIAGQKFDGVVKRVSPIVDPMSGTFKVTIGVLNHGNSLRPGMFVNANVITATQKDALLVPKNTIIFENESMFVFVVQEDSVAKKVRLQEGLQDYNYVQIHNEDLKPGDKIIAVGQAGLKSNTKVKIVEDES